MNAAATTGLSRLARIRALLAQAFEPAALEVVDESDRHIGHPGARSGAGHFRVHIVAEQFAGQARLARHRSIYAALGEMMHTDIHALSIEALTPSETRPHPATHEHSTPQRTT
jgi:BolA protein